MAKAAHRALGLVRLEDPLAEALLVEAALGHRRDVLPAGLHRCLRHLYSDLRVLGVVDGRAEAEASGIVGYDVHRPDRQILARNHPEQEDQGHAALHRQPEADIVAVTRISPAVAVEEEPARSHAIFVGAWLAFHDGNRGDAEWYFGQDGGLEDALGADERDAGAVEGEAGGEEGAREDFAVQLGLLGEDLERRQPHALVSLTRASVHSNPLAAGAQVFGTN